MSATPHLKDFPLPVENIFYHSDRESVLSSFIAFPNEVTTLTLPNVQNMLHANAINAKIRMNNLSVEQAVE
jgi:hypothetical protein